MVRIIFLFYAMTFFAPAHKTIEPHKHKLSISGTMYFSSISEGGIQRDNSNPSAIPFGKCTMYVVCFISADSIPKLVKSFTTNENGVFSVSLPPGKYGFVTAEEAKGVLLKGQCLPQNTETNISLTRNTSSWGCSIPCPIELTTASIKNVVIANSRASYCMNCQ